MKERADKHEEGWTLPKLFGPMVVEGKVRGDSEPQDQQYNLRECFFIEYLDGDAW